MRTLAFLAALPLLAGPALADTHYTAIFAESGASGAAARLADIADPTPSDRLALGGAQFLAAVEGALQARYAHGLSSDQMAMGLDLPFFRLPVPPNPQPAPFTGAVLTDMLENALDDLANAAATLDTIADGDDAALVLRPGDLWLDIDGDGSRGPGEDLSEVAAHLFAADGDWPVTLEIRFDTADAAWLSAYAHALSGMSELILATDPAPTIDAIRDATATFDAARHPGETITTGFVELPEIDALTIVFKALEGPLDADRTRAAHAHFRAMIADNRVFWTRVAAETDDDREWIPAAGQTSALPLTFPDGIAESWQAVLADAEAVLAGDLLLPHWRLGDGAGVNLARLLQDPPDFDLIGLLQGYSLAPYAERGPVIDGAALRRFDEMTGGNSPLFAIILN